MMKCKKIVFYACLFLFGVAQANSTIEQQQQNSLKEIQSKKQLIVEAKKILINDKNELNQSIAESNINALE
ncbi:hypothetical protein [Candidatus Thioglobus sp.]|uniref:hypothetical protein n=1 Tax=Candidatus Thioglobus sp. TaxID=2026721 RepID=UPI003D0F4025